MIRMRAYVCLQVKGRDERLAKAETLLRATLAAKDQEVEAAKVWHTGDREKEPFAACSHVLNECIGTVTGDTV